MVRCPYNKAHVLLKHRLASHLVKCRRQHPQKEFMRCPFNSSHDILASEFEDHTKICQDRKKLESFMYVVGEPKQENAVLYHSEVKCTEENWDEEPEVASSYLDEKDRINSGRMIARRPPAGMTKSERKAFYLAETQRLEKFKKENIVSNSPVTKQM